MATNATQFVVKAARKVKKGNGERTFYNEVGRLFIREGEKGLSGTLYLHLTGGEYAVWPVEPKDEEAGNGE